MTIPQAVKLVEVGPRDGLQNESAPVSTADKINLIHGLIDAGVSYIEAGSFVNPRSVPQMADSDQVFAGLRSSPAFNLTALTLAALTPNLKGFERAMQAGVTEVAVFASASEGFSAKNINCTIAESLTRFEPLMQAARDNNVAVRGYISCVVGCPYDGEVAPQQVDLVSRALFDMGCYEVSLGDTIGVFCYCKPRRTNSPCTVTTPMVRPWPIFAHHWNMALLQSMPRWRVWVAAPMRSMRRAM
jgi:hydroxymethylglutaryl-CoA lyase